MDTLGGWALDGSEPRYYLSNAPEDTPLEILAYVGGSRWRIETEFETEKSDMGLDEYETRTWPGWHHHGALCLLGGAFLLSLQQAWGGKMPRITRPQVYRVVREMLPRERFGPAEFCGGLRIRRIVANGPAASMQSAAPSSAHPQTSRLEPTLSYWSNKTNIKTNMTADQHYEWRR